MKKIFLLKICFILFVTIFSNAYANEFMENIAEVRKKNNADFALTVTLDIYMSKHSSWNLSDKSSLSYIASRCGILNKVLSEKYKHVGAQDAAYKLLLTDAVLFSRASSDIYKTRCINYDCIKEKKIIAQQREKKWALIYEEAFEYILIDGEIRKDFGSSLFVSDISTCLNKVKPILK
jgi:hypothetical protein